MGVFNDASLNNDFYFASGAKNSSNGYAKSSKSSSKKRSGKSKKSGYYEYDEKGYGRYRKPKLGGYTALILILLAVIAICYYLYKGGYIFKEETPERFSGLDQIFSGVTSSQSGEMKVHFIDVGQGDCIFIQFPDGKNMLIDSGDNRKKNSTRWNTADKDKSNSQVIKEYLASAGVDSDITVLLATHADADHIGNMSEIFKEYNVSYCLRPSVYYSGTKGEFDSEFNPQPTVKKHTDQGSDTYYNYLKALQDEGCSWEFFNYETDFSQEFTFDGGTYSYSVDFLTPLEDVGSIGYSNNANNYSPIMWIKYGEFDLILTGDAETKTLENQFVKYVNDTKYNLPTTVELFKAGHHGASTASSLDFINLFKPLNTVFSCGAGNSYGHPHEEAMQNVLAVNSAVWRTDLQGNICFTVKADGSCSAKTQNENTVEYSALIKCPERNK